MNPSDHSPGSLQVCDEVRTALEKQRPVVALESTLIAHGLPWPENHDCARRLEQAIREEGAVPAMVAVVEGTLRVGLTEDEQAILAERGPEVPKATTRDLPMIVARGEWGATTVAATLFAARSAGISIFATGGIGGVHRGVNASFDVSADIQEMANSPIMVVCSGAKSILDVEKTLEALETAGVGVIGFGTDYFPGFYTRGDIPIGHRVDSAAEAAQVLAAMTDVGCSSAQMLANPVPTDAALSAEIEAGWIDQALKLAEEQQISGKALTPFVLQELHRLSGGATQRANLALVESNARLAARVIVAACELRRESR